MPPSRTSCSPTPAASPPAELNRQSDGRPRRRAVSVSAAPITSVVAATAIVCPAWPPVAGSIGRLVVGPAIEVVGADVLVPGRVMVGGVVVAVVVLVVAVVVLVVVVVGAGPTVTVTVPSAVRLPSETV